MKLFFGGSAAFTAATLLSASVLFYAKPLSAETPATHQPASLQQEKKENTEIATADAPTRQPETQQATGTTVGAGPESVPVTIAPDKSGKLTGVVPVETTAAAAAAEPVAGPQAYVATAYSLTGRTASGMRVAKGIIAADPRILPLGSRVRLEAGPYSGEYIVADTGSAVRGRKIDVWVPSYAEACRFGRRNIKLSVLSYGKRKRARSRS